MELKRDQTLLFFEEKGEGPFTFVLIHGTGGDHTHMQPQFDDFSKQGKVVSVDLRGHGKSDKPHENYTLELFADDIHFICQERNIVKPILVGFSMGGNIAIDLATRYPDFSRAIVILDSGFLYPIPVLAMMKDYLHELKEGDFAGCIHKIVENGLLPTDRCKQFVEKSLLSTPQYVWASAFENMMAWDAHVATHLKKCKLPLLYIEAAKQLVDLEVLKKLCPQLIHGKVIGSGHSLSLEVPEQVNPMIEKFLQLLF
jgi:pimeloyl-ACP methyl ester carboxylesterase